MLAALFGLCTSSATAAYPDQSQTAAACGACLASAAGTSLEGGISLYCEGNDTAALQLWRPLAETGDPAAELAIGRLYENGAGTPVDYSAAIGWYRKAADKGVAQAQFYLAMMYDRGRGVPASYPAALVLLLKAGDQGNASAEHKLGEFYAQGLGVQKNLSESVRWFRKVADEGSIDAEFYLGLAYAGGDGVPQDYVEGYKWFTIAASEPLEPQILRDAFLNSRARVSAKMTPSQISEGEARATAWRPVSQEARFVLSSPDGPGSSTPPLNPVCARPPSAAADGAAPKTGG